VQVDADPTAGIIVYFSNGSSFSAPHHRVSAFLLSCNKSAPAATAHPNQDVEPGGDSAPGEARVRTCARTGVCTQRAQLLF
jgi:hypothetical protein